MNGCIDLKLFATLRRFLPEDAERYPVGPGLKVGDLVARLGIRQKDAKLIFIDGKKGSLDSMLTGGERVGIFPPVGGGCWTWTGYSTGSDPKPGILPSRTGPYARGWASGRSVKSPKIWASARAGWKSRRYRTACCPSGTPGTCGRSLLKSRPAC